VSDDVQDRTTTSIGLPRRKPEDFLVGGGAPIHVPPDQRRRTPGRFVTVLVMIVALVGAGITRHLAMGYQERHSPTVRRTASGSAVSLAGMDSYALALLLGGLRGPLVMVLWANSESQKADRDLEGVDTQIEWIRRLQPEFDTVHIFQMWNKAYNLSVQMVGLSNKYTTILDALDYGRSIDAERPDNLNIIKEIARTYGEKLGNSIPEKHYYRERLRRESMYREQAQPQRAEGFQRVAHDSVLDANGNILAKFVTPRFPGKPYDGSDLQFLKQYQPFPYGVSPAAFGYNYHKRAQVLMETQDQKPIQISTSVLDSQPALALKGWSEEEWERSRRMEIKAFGLPLPPERLDQELPTADIPLDAKPADTSLIAEMIHGYDQATRLARDSEKEYERHLSNPEFATKRAMYGSHIDQVRGMGVMCAADRDYLKAMQTPAGDPARAKLLASARQSYRDTIREFGLTAIRYFTADRLATAVLPKGVNRANIGTGPLGSATQVTDEDVLRFHAAIGEQIQRAGGEYYDENAEDRKEYDTYITRALQRIAHIDAAAAGATPTAVNVPAD
jgi:hypothetical protein